MNRYYAHLSGDTKEMRDIIEKYAHMICNFYTTSSTFIDNSEDILNSKVNIQYDTRFYHFEVLSNYYSSSMCYLSYDYILMLTLYFVLISLYRNFYLPYFLH